MTSEVIDEAIIDKAFNALEEFILADEDESDPDSKIRRFHVSTYFHGNSCDTLEEARAYVRKQLRRNPFTTATYYISEVLEASKSQPQGEVCIRTLSMTDYYNAKQLENTK